MTIQQLHVALKTIDTEIDKYCRSGRPTLDEAYSFMAMLGCITFSRLPASVQRNVDFSGWSEAIFNTAWKKMWEKI